MKKYVIIVMLLAAIAVGAYYMGRLSADKSAQTPVIEAEPTEASTPEPTEAPTSEPTEAPTPEPTEVPTKEVLKVEWVTEDGTGRKLVVVRDLDTNDPDQLALAEELVRTELNKLTAQEFVNLAVQKAAGEENSEHYARLLPGEVVLSNDDGSTVTALSVAKEIESEWTLLRDGAHLIVENEQEQVTIVHSNLRRDGTYEPITVGTWNDRTATADALCEAHNSVRMSAVTSTIQVDATNLEGVFKVDRRFDKNLLVAWIAAADYHQVAGEWTYAWGISLNVCAHGGDTKAPVAKATAVPATQPRTTAQPTAAPVAKPTAVPTAMPTAAPTAKPTAKPTAAPTAAPTAKPTDAPTAAPTHNPPAATYAPTAAPTARPTHNPPAATYAPTVAPTARPTHNPPSATAEPELGEKPTQAPVPTHSAPSATAEPVLGEKPTQAPAAATAKPAHNPPSATAEPVLGEEPTQAPAEATAKPARHSAPEATAEPVLGD